MLGVIVNTLTVTVGGALGLLLKKGLPKRISDTLMKGLGLCTAFIGITGALKGENTLLIIISMVAGAIIGELVDIDRRVNKLGEYIQKKVGRPGADGEESTLAKGFVSASLLFCVGAMTIVGSLQSGLTGDHTMIFTKSVMDFCSSMIFASSFGAGVLFSAVFLFVYQGAITLLASFIAPYLTDAVINEMTCVGSIIIIGLALNILGITKLKVMNYVPAIFLPIALCPLFNYLSAVRLF